MDRYTCYHEATFCVDCGKGVDPFHADLSRSMTHFITSRGVREGFVLCEQHLDREKRRGLAGHSHFL